MGSSNQSSPGGKLRRLLILVAALMLAPAAVAQADLRADVNALRARHGLTALSASDPLAAQLTAEIAAEPSHQGSSSYQCGCEIPDPTAYYTKNAGIVYDERAGYGPADQDPDFSGDTRAAFFEWPARGTLAQRLANFPGAYALILDPRATTFDVTVNGQRQAFGVTVNPAIRWKTPILTSARAFDPAGRTPLWVVMPPVANDNNVGADLQMRSGRRWTTVARSTFDTTNGGVLLAGDGAATDSYTYMDEVGDVPYAATFRFVAHGVSPSRTFRTIAEPAALIRRSWRFARSMSGADRRRFTAAIADARPEVRRLLRQVAPFTIITQGQLLRHEGHLGYSTSADNGFFKVTLDVSVLPSIRAERDETTLHELGHILEFSGLSDPVINRINRLRAPQGRCSSDIHIAYWQQGPCAPPEEWFADSFSKWALRETQFRSDVGYHVLPPRNMAAFGRAVLRGYRLVSPKFPLA